MIPLRKRTKTILCPGHCQKILSCLPCPNMMIMDWSTCICRWTSPSPNLHYWWLVTYLIWVNIDALIGTKLFPYFVQNQWRLIIICSPRLEFYFQSYNIKSELGSITFSWSTITHDHILKILWSAIMIGDHFSDHYEFGKPYFPW